MSKKCFLVLFCMSWADMLTPSNAQLANFTELQTTVGMTFVLELAGPQLSALDRVLLRDSGSGCPGELFYSDDISSSAAVASRVCHQPGVCEPSPIYARLGPAVARGPKGLLVASFFPTMLRWRGTFRICYCSGDPHGVTSGITAADDSPCDSADAVYPFVGVLYVVTIEPSGDNPIASCAIDRDGKLLSGCMITVKSRRGGLSVHDVAMLLPDDATQICGEGTSIGTALLPHTGSATEWKFEAREGMDVSSAWSRSFANRQLKVCYCQRGDETYMGSTCAPGYWQLAGRVALVGFNGPASGGEDPAEFVCYWNSTCRAGPVSGFGLGMSDVAAIAAGKGGCAGLDYTFEESHKVLWYSNDVVTAVLPSTDTGLTEFGSVCYCSATLHGRVACAANKARMFTLLLGYVRLTGLKSRYNIDCVPAAGSCPESPMQLDSEDVNIARHGRLFVVERTHENFNSFVRGPCDEVDADKAIEAEMLPRVSLPWPIAPGSYALCFCEDAIGCPGGGREIVPSMQEVGSVSVWGSIRSVTLKGEVGVATIPLVLQMLRPVPGVRCCARAEEHRGGDGNGVETASDTCVDLKASKFGELSLATAYPYSSHVVLPGPRPPGSSGAFTVFCRAFAEQGRCAAEGARCAMPSGGLKVELQQVPRVWQGPWRYAAGSDAGIMALAEHAGSSSRFKVVPHHETGATCSHEGLDDVVDGLPCYGAACSQNGLTAIKSGRYSICICEHSDFWNATHCEGWYYMGTYIIYGPSQWRLSPRAVLQEPILLHVEGTSLSAQDRITTVLGSSCGNGTLLSSRTILAPRSSNSTSIRVEATFTVEATYSLCWSPAKDSDSELLIGTIIASREEVDCEVGVWANTTGCGAPCGVGLQTWRRPIVQLPSRHGAQCPQLETARTCQGPRCPRIESWAVSPQRPLPSQSFVLSVVAWASMPNLRSVLVPLEASTRAQATQCSPNSAEAAAAWCNMEPASYTVMPQAKCKFASNGSLVPGVYEVCLCVGSGDGQCLGYFAGLGQLVIGRPAPPSAEGEGSLLTHPATILCLGLVVVLMLSLVALAYRRRQKWYTDVAELPSPKSKHAVASFPKDDGAKLDAPHIPYEPPVGLQPEPEPPATNRTLTPPILPPSLPPPFPPEAPPPPSTDQMPTELPGSMEAPPRLPSKEKKKPSKEKRTATKKNGLSEWGVGALSSLDASDMEANAYDFALPPLPSARPMPVPPKGPKPPPNPPSAPSKESWKGDTRRSQLLQQSEKFLRREANAATLSGHLGSLDEFLNEGEDGDAIPSASRSQSVSPRFRCQPPVSRSVTPQSGTPRQPPQVLEMSEDESSDEEPDKTGDGIMFIREALAAWDLPTLPPPSLRAPQPNSSETGMLEDQLPSLPSLPGENAPQQSSAVTGVLENQLPSLPSFSTNKGAASVAAALPTLPSLPPSLSDAPKSAEVAGAVADGPLVQHSPPDISRPPPEHRPDAHYDQSAPPSTCEGAPRHHFLCVERAPPSKGEGVAITEGEPQFHTPLRRPAPQAELDLTATPPQRPTANLPFDESDGASRDGGSSCGVCSANPADAGAKGLAQDVAASPELCSTGVPTSPFEGQSPDVTSSTSSSPRPLGAEPAAAQHARLRPSKLAPLTKAQPRPKKPPELLFEAGPRTPPSANQDTATRTQPDSALPSKISAATRVLPPPPPPPSNKLAAVARDEGHEGGAGGTEPTFLE